MLVYRNYLKPLADILVSFIVLVITAPILILTSLLLMIVNKGTAFFLQERAGKDEKVFKVIKFKTMNNKRDANGDLLPDTQRITFIGNIVRKLSIDELPQLINVLKGDMSLVGPRPFISQYLPLYSEEQRKRHQVKPGITGWAQVNGRNTISWKEKIQYDIWYVEHTSLSLDIKILFLTVKKLFKHSEINQSRDTTAEYFNGNN
jgi:undecaprenyl phosphate N,N'-diacetylbacillosamine 1-phosphate transferase